MRANAAAEEAKPSPETGLSKRDDGLVPKREGRSRAEWKAEAVLSTVVRHATSSRMWGDDFFMVPGQEEEPSTLSRCCEIVNERCEGVRDGNLDVVTDMLVAQMGTLDTLFSAMMNRAAQNAGQYPEAFDRYMGWALKAQANARVTAETLARIKRGGKQTVKVIHVHEGGQAVVADTVNNGTTGGKQGDGERR